MLRNLNDLENFAIGAIDGDIGHIKDFYFDDHAWVIRYLVVETGSWLSSRRVLISPISIGTPDTGEKLLRASITREQVKNSPSIDTDKPVSRQNETEYLGYYGYPSYWGGAGLWGEGLYPYAMVPGYSGERIGREARENELEAYVRDERARHRDDDPHLRSSQAVNGYQIHARDGDVGKVASLIIDQETWAVRYFVIRTGNWWSGHDVLISPQWITGVNWSDRSVSVDLDRESVKDAPPYESTELLNRQTESRLYDHYGRASYWSRDALAPTMI